MKTQTLRFALLSAAVLGFLGCPTTTNKCSVNTDCKAGEICSANKCVQGVLGGGGGTLGGGAGGGGGGVSGGGGGTTGGGGGSVTGGGGGTTGGGGGSTGGGGGSVTGGGGGSTGGGGGSTGGGGGTACNASTCTTGCCTSADVCMPGTTDLACGTNAVLCATCVTGTTQCSVNQVCVSVSTGGGGGSTGGGGGSTGGGGGSVVDAGTIDEQIVAVRTVADTITDGGAVSLTITGALVTYLKPFAADAGTSDPAGFFIQGTQNGAALFVAIDPATVTGGPFVVGDLVNLNVLTVTKLGGVRTVVAVTGATKSSSGNPTSGLTASVSAVDFLAAGQLDTYESRLISLSGTTLNDPVTVGSGYKGIGISTTGTPDAGTNLRLRLPAALMDAQSFGPGCTFTLTGTPMWRFNAAAQPSAWAQSEVTNIVCPAPAVLSAAATSGTAVTVSFSRDLAPASVTSGAFAITPSLSVSAAAPLSARSVSLTTATQTAATVYTVTVANTVTDTRGTAVPGTANSTTFTGVAGSVCSPGLIISAIYGGGGNSGATYSYDFVELKNRTSAPINLAGWSIQYGGTAGMSWTAVSLTGTVPANGYFLIRGAIGGTVTNIPLPTAFDQDASGLQMGGTNGVVALVNSTAALTACPAAGTVADLVGYGSATCREGTSTAVLSSTLAAYRAGNGCTDSNVNSADLTVSAVGSTAPKNTSSTANVCTCP